MRKEHANRGYIYDRLMASVAKGMRIREAAMEFGLNKNQAIGIIHRERRARSMMAEPPRPSPKPLAPGVRHPREIVDKVRELMDDGGTRQGVADQCNLTLDQVKNICQHHGIRSKTNSRLNVSMPRPAGLPPKVILERIEVPAGAFEVPAGKVGVANLKPAQCKFICDDGYFCGEATGGIAKTYCQHHHDICWINPKQKGKVKWRNFRVRASQLSA